MYSLGEHSKGYWLTTNKSGEPK